jgi:hypothetical protein
VPRHALRDGELSVGPGRRQAVRVAIRSPITHCRIARPRPGHLIEVRIRRALVRRIDRRGLSKLVQHHRERTRSGIRLLRLAFSDRRRGMPGHDHRSRRAIEPCKPRVARRGGDVLLRCEISLN